MKVLVVTGVLSPPRRSGPRRLGLPAGAGQPGGGSRAPRPGAAPPGPAAHGHPERRSKDRRPRAPPAAPGRARRSGGGVPPVSVPRPSVGRMTAGVSGLRPWLARRLHKRTNKRFDLVHAHYALPAGDAVRRAAPDLPLVVSVTVTTCFGAGAGGRRVQTVLEHARLVLANSAGTARRCRTAGASQVRVVHLARTSPGAHAPPGRAGAGDGGPPGPPQAPRGRAAGRGQPAASPPSPALRDRRRRTGPGITHRRWPSWG